MEGLKQRIEKMDGIWEGGKLYILKMDILPELSKTIAEIENVKPLQRVEPANKEKLDGYLLAIGDVLKALDSKRGRK